MRYTEGARRNVLFSTTQAANHLNDRAVGAVRDICTPRIMFHGKVLFLEEKMLERGMTSSSKRITYEQLR